MIFAVDVGNTNIVVGAIDGEDVKFVERISTDKTKTDLEYAMMFKSVLEIRKISVSDIEGSIISSVVPEINQILKTSIEKLLNKTPLIIGPGVKTGLNIKLNDPAELGADMVVAAVAAIKEYPLPQIIFDLGTATTISVISKEGDFLGGSILSGVKTSLESIINKSSLLTNISYDSPGNVIGKSTIECLKSGVVYGTASMMDGMIDKIENELKEKPTVIATGGLSSYFIKYCNHEIIFDDQLLLKGLGIIYKKNS